MCLSNWFLIRFDYILTHSPVHLADVFLHRAGVEVNKESPGGLGTLPEAVGNRFVDVKVLGALSKAIREPVA